MDAEEIRSEDDRLIVNDVARAVEERELIAYYQPLVDLESMEVVGAESLVRWTMPDGTVVPAGLFVPSLDRTGTIFGLDWFMAEDVCAFLSSVVGTPAFVPISLNFSARHASHHDFAKSLLATIGWHEGVTPDCVRVELSEGIVLKGDPEVDALVDDVLASGVAVVADKCELGVEGLDRLARRGIGFAKISRAWWAEHSDEELAQLVREAAAKGIRISAEGVELAEEAQRLKDAGFTCAQGFGLGRPEDGAAFIRTCEK